MNNETRKKIEEAAIKEAGGWDAEREKNKLIRFGEFCYDLAIENISEEINELNKALDHQGKALHALAESNVELLKDKARLEWVIRKQAWLAIHRGYFHMRYSDGETMIQQIEYKTPRDAIDASMAEENK